jgi:hypothetical protein
MTPVALRVVRGFAVFDLLVTGLMALPPTAAVFVDVLYAVNGGLGGPAGPPQFQSVHWMFVNVAGVLGVLWALARIVEPTRFLGLTDAAGRACAGGLIAWHILAGSAPVALFAFVFTEWLGAAAQWQVLLRRGP